MWFILKQTFFAADTLCGSVNFCVLGKVKGFFHCFFAADTVCSSVNFCVLGKVKGFFHCFFQAASIVRTVALSFKAIGKMTREKLERASRRAKRTHSISSSERTRTNSEVSTTSTVGSSSERRHPHVQWKHSLEGTNGRKSPHGKKFNKNSASPSILRHPSSSHTSGRHVEFSALSPVPSDGSDCDGREATASQNNAPESTLQRNISVRVDVHSALSSDSQSAAPVWIKREGVGSNRRSSVTAAQNRMFVSESKPLDGNESFSVKEVPDQALKEDTSSIVISHVDVEAISVDVMAAPPQAKRALSESLEKAATHRELHSVVLEKGTISENFMTSGSFLPVEHFQSYKELVLSPDHAQQLFNSAVEDRAEDEVLHLAIGAVERGEATQVEKFLDSGLSVNAHDVARRSLLYHAVSLGYVELSQMLLKRYVRLIGNTVYYQGPQTTDCRVT